MAERFYTSSALRPGPALLQGPEARHLAAVMRFRPGDRVVLFNGDGHQYPADVVAVERKSVTLDVIAVESPARERGAPVVVATPLPKGDRADFLIEKLTELGATAFVPLRTARSVVHPRDSKLDRLRQAVIEASKQCGRNVLMGIESMTDWAAFVTRSDLPAARVVAHPTGTDSVPELGTGVAFAIGPEGGLTDEEVTEARSAGWRVVGLGPRILRVETAAVLLVARLG